jgi:23S rRNA pseudouridine2604 synthase
MSFQQRIKFFLVHKLMLSNKTADELITKGWVEIDGVTIYENCFLPETAEIKVNGKIEREKKELIYLKFNKPAGFESTLSPGVPGNLCTFFDGLEGLSIAGRLDKASEGLMLLSNDGKWVEYICNPKSFKEKEYLVTLDKQPDANFRDKFSKGVMIGKHQTLPCFCELLTHSTLRVILTEGKNRQIRRMCKVLGAKVLKLKRIRIAEFVLGDLPEGKIEMIMKPGPVVIQN